MNKLLLSAALFSLASLAHAGDEIIPLGSAGGGYGVLRDGGNLYRHPLASDGGENMTAEERLRARLYRPTQHFYMRNHIVSYRYTSTRLTEWNNSTPRNYLGPAGAVFVPLDRDLPADGSIRNFATLTRRTQPGVPMVPRGRASRTTRTGDAPTTTIQLVSRK